MGKGYSSFGNATSLGTSGRTGPSILVSKSNRGSFSRILNYFPQNKRSQIIKSEANFLYGVNGSVYRRGLSP
jgi:hypothetical protein